MQTASRILSLTPDHIARIHRVVEDTGPTSGVQQQTDADYADWVARIAQSHPAPDRPTQLFAYGSLIWSPRSSIRPNSLARQVDGVVPFACACTAFAVQPTILV